MSVERSSPSDYHPYQNHTWIQLHEVVVEKEYQLECFKDDLQRLSVSESESKRKDQVILALRKDIAEYKKCTQSRNIRHASIEDQLGSSESHLQDRIQEVQKLQSELESMKGKLRSTSSKSASAQKELSQLSQTHMQQSQELRELKKRQNGDEESIATLRRELTEKKRNAASTQERTKALRSENQELQKRIESLQASMGAKENTTKEELAKLRKLSSDGKLLQAKFDFTEQELLNAKDKENTMAVELGRVESELSEVCSHVLASFQVPRAEHRVASPHQAIQVVTQFSNDYTKIEEKLSLCEQELEQVKESDEVVNDGILDLCKSLKEYQDGINSDLIGALRQLSESLQKICSESENFNKLLDILRGSNAVLCSLQEQGQNRLPRLESHITSCYRAEKEEVNDVFTMVSNMASSLQSSYLQISKLREQLVENGLEHNASLSGAVTAMRQDELKRMNDAMEKTKLEDKEKLCRELENARELHALEMQQAVQQEQAIAAALSKEVETIKLTVGEDAEEKESIQAKLADAESRVVVAERNRSETESQAENYKDTLERQFTEETAGYREQAQQYARTIVAMEEKLLGMMEKWKALQAENQSLKEHLDGVKTTSSKEVKGQAEKIKKFDELTSVLRHQLRLTSEDVSRKETAMEQLENDILELKKKEEDNQAQLKKMHSEEISDLQLTMAKQEAIIECQKNELETLSKKVDKKTSQLDKNGLECARMTENISVLQKTLAESTTVDDLSTLTAAGHTCLGANHGDIISNQKTAIAQLRERVTELELAKPPIGSHQATLKELSRVRHELLKAKSHTKTDVVTSTPSKSKETETFNPQFTFMEESKSQETALQQLEETLQCSERVYKNLVESICKAMPDLTRYPLEDEDKLIPTDEQTRKKQVLKDRKKFADTVHRQLVRQATNLKLQAPTAKSDHCSTADDAEDVAEIPQKTPAEVIQDLEEDLSATMEELEQQKRLNQSLLKRKNFKETQLVASLQRPRHKCASTGRNNHQRSQSHQNQLL